MGTARYDKYDPISGGFRAPLNAPVAANAAGTLLAVGLNASGRVVLGAGNTGIKAVLVVDQAKVAGDIVDCMTDGEIVDCEGLSAGTSYFGVPADGLVNATSATNTALGHTVEATRLIVRVAR